MSNMNLVAGQILLTKVIWKDDLNQRLRTSIWSGGSKYRAEARKNNGKNKDSLHFDLLVCFNGRSALCEE